MGAASKRAKNVSSTGDADQRVLDDGSTSVALPICKDGHPFGCIELVGRGPDINAVATALKMSFEIRLKFDELDRVQKSATNKNEAVIKRLLITANDTPPASRVLEQAGFSSSVPRQMLLLKSASSGFLDHFSCVNISYDSDEDIAAAIKERVIVLKDVSKADGELRRYLSNYISHLRENTPFVGQVYTSALNTSIDRLPQTYDRLIWLETNARWLSPGDDTLFFSDFISDYFMSMVPEDVYAEVFRDTVDISAIDVDEFVSLTDALLNSNFNLVRASKSLYMHKNTLVYKLNKYKTLLSIDPMNSRADRDLMRYLCFYLKHIEIEGGEDGRD